MAIIFQSKTLNLLEFNDTTGTLIVKLPTGNSNSFQEWQNSAGTVLANVDSAGFVNGSAYRQIGGNSNGFGIGTISSVLTAFGGGGNAAVVPVVVRGAASQTANLQEWQNSAGTVIAKVQSDGTFYNGIITTNIFSTQTLNTGSASFSGVAYNGISNPTGVTTLPTLVIKGIASQTANLQEWQDSAGTVLARVSNLGLLQTADLATGSAAMYGLGSFGGGYNSNQQLLINIGASNRIGLIVKAAASQTANLQEWQDNSGNILLSVSGSSANMDVRTIGNFYLRTSNNNSINIQPYVSAGNPVATFNFNSIIFRNHAPITAESASSQGLIVKGASSQTADLQQWQDSAGTVLSGIGPNGRIFAQGKTGNTDDLLYLRRADNNVYMYVDKDATLRGNFSIRLNQETSIDTQAFIWSGTASRSALGVSGTGSTNPTFYVKAVASQTSNLTEWQNSAGTVLASISPTGKLTSAVDASINGVVIGMGAGSASSNTSVGLNSLVSNTTGTYNTAFGNQSLQLNTSGTQNTAFGQNALYNNRTGWYNTAFGQGALQNNNYAYSNTAIGTAAMINNVSGSGNTAVGIASLQSNISGGNNVVIGSNSGYSNSTGSGNIFLGTESGYYETGSNKLYIANTNTTTPLIGGDFSAKTLTFAGNATITSQATGTVGLIVKAIASQSANLQEWQNSAGTVVASMRGDGLFNSYWGYHTYLQPQSGIGAYINLTNNGIIIAGYTNVADKILVVKGMSGQTGNLQEWQNSSGTVLANVTSSGAFFAQSLSSSSTGYQGNISSNDGTKGNLNFNTSGYGLLVTSAQTSAVVLTARGAASQTGNLQEWQDSTGAVGFRVNASPQTIGFNAATTARIQVGSVDTMTYNASTGWAFTPYDSSKIVLTVKAATSQTANLQEWQNSSGTLLSAIDKAGNLTKGDGDQLVLASQIFG